MEPLAASAQLDWGLTALIVSVVALLFQILVAVSAAVWVVAQIRNSTATLGTRLSLSMEHLSSAIEGLRTWVEKVDEKTDHTAEQVAEIRGQIHALHEHHQPPPG